MEQFSTEEQQVEAIKRFWKENGFPIIIGAAIGFGGLFGWRYYNDSVVTQQEQASEAYTQVLEELNKGPEGFSKGIDFVKGDSDSNYRVLVALRLAKEAVERNDLPEAEKQLQWSADNIDVAAIKGVALLRLARVQLQQEQHDKALASLEKVTDEAFKAKVAEVRGDVYQRQGKLDKAREQYSAALEDDANNSFLKMKLDDLASQATS